jgi:FAD/FMN-containing dehydrogenase
MSISLRVNLRYNGTYRPAAIGYVNSAKQVSEVVKIGHDPGYNVVARSGGVSFGNHFAWLDFY